MASAPGGMYATETANKQNADDSEHELWIALLLADGSFPGGALANSQGLEAAMAHGVARKGDVASLRSFARITLEQAAHQSLPFVLAAHALGVARRRERVVDAGIYTDAGTDINIGITLDAGAGIHAGADAGADTGRDADAGIDADTGAEADALCRAFHQLDCYLHACSSSEVGRQASVNQGKCFARVVREAFPHIAHTLGGLLSPTQLRQGQQQQGHTPGRVRCHCHFASVFGLCCGLLGLRAGLVCRLYLRCLLRYALIMYCCTALLLYCCIAVLLY
jgi:urease accessory protein UreF